MYYVLERMIIRGRRKSVNSYGHPYAYIASMYSYTWTNIVATIVEYVFTLTPKHFLLCLESARIVCSDACVLINQIVIGMDLRGCEIFTQHCTII